MKLIKYIRRLSMLCTGLLWSLLTGAQLGPGNIKAEKLLGKVKTLTEIINDQTKTVDMFNEKGSQTDHWFFKPLDVLRMRYKWVYNEKNQLLEETQFDNGISPRIRYSFGYNSQGIAIGRSMYGANNSLLEKYIYSYNERGKLADSIRMDQYGNIIERHSWQYEQKHIKQTWFSRDDNSTLTTEYEYNSRGKLLKEKRYDSHESPLDYTAWYTYDTMGNRTSEQKEFRNGKGNYKKLYDHDSRGNIISQTSFKNDKIDEKKENFFNAKGQLIEESLYDASGKLVVRYIHQYDDKGNQVSMDRYMVPDKRDSRVDWKYEYDKQGNWILRTQYVNGAVLEVIKRGIEYY